MKWNEDNLLTAGVPMRRVVAWLFDLLVVAIVGFALWLLLVAIGLLTLGIGLPLLALLPVLPFAYHAGFLAARGATPGMALLGITARNDADLARPNLAQALLFTTGLYVTLALGAFLLIVALFTTRRRALHDLLSGLVIVRTRALTVAPPYWNIARGPWTA